MSKIECVGVPINRQKSVWVKKNFIEAWRLTFVGGHRADDQTHANWVFADYVSDDLILLLMYMAIELPSDHVLIPVNDCVESSAIGSKTLFNIRNMTNNDSCTINLFKFTELILQPFKHISWIMEINE